MSLNLKAVEALYNTNDSFKAMVDKSLAAEHQRLIKAAAMFEVESTSETIVEPAKTNRIPGSRNHKAAVLSILQKLGGSASVSDIRSALSTSGHEITNSTLTTVLHNMKTTSELSVTGPHGHGIYSVP